MAKPPRFISSARFLILSPMILCSLVFLLPGIGGGEEPKGERAVLSLPEIIDMAISQEPGGG